MGHPGGGGMQTRYWPLMAGLTLCLTAALGCVTYIFTGGESPLLAFAICASALLVGQVVLGAYAALQADFSESSDRKILKKVATFGASRKTSLINGPLHWNPSSISRRAEPLITAFTLAPFN
jgi:hypothetical protein